MKDYAPIGGINVLAASQELIVGNISFQTSRTFSATCRVKYAAGTGGAVKVKLYFSPDGKNYDSVAFSSFDVTLSAGAIVQMTKVIDVPEEGYMSIAVQNLDASHIVTEVMVWVTIQEWGGNRK